MGSDIRAGEKRPLRNKEEVAAFPEAVSRRVEAGPPIFQNGEIIELRGGKFEVRMLGNMIGLIPRAG